MGIRFIESLLRLAQRTEDRPSANRARHGKCLRMTDAFLREPMLFVVSVRNSIRQVAEIVALPPKRTRTPSFLAP